MPIKVHLNYQQISLKLVIIETFKKNKIVFNKKLYLSKNNYLYCAVNNIAAYK